MSFGAKAQTSFTWKRLIHMKFSRGTTADDQPASAASTLA
jgi:hypothetical protein